MIDWAKVNGFEWDGGNARKNEKHEVSTAEAEQVFFNAPLLVLKDPGHSSQEQRFHALGETDDRRKLRVTFALRHAGEKFRVISPKDMHRKERVIYEKVT